MEIKELYPFVYTIVLVGMILGVGVLVFGYFTDATRINTLVTNETVTFTSGVGNLAGDSGYITGVTSVGNMTYGATVNDLTANFSSNGTVWLNSSFSTTKYNVTYNYEDQSQAGLIMGNSTVSAAPIATTWLPLIVTIASLAIILVLVIRSFARKR